MIKNAQWIEKMCTNGGDLITPFVGWQVRKADYGPCISYGLGGYGYDLRLSPQEFKIFEWGEDCVDPKNFKDYFLKDAVRGSYTLAGCDTTREQFFVLPAHTYGLGVSVEKLHIPDNIQAIFIGKSTYARCGVIVNMTPGEAGWKGHLTIEISNSSDCNVKIYANEGICQAMFFEGEETSILYEGRKYQDQPHKIVTARV